MRILVVGVGKVGHNIAEELVREEHDIVIIDKNEDVLRACCDSLDVIGIKGNGANVQVLLNAKADEADMLIATTESDEINMLCCLIAKRLGTGHVIARIRDPGYHASLNLLQKELDIDMVVNPERATALEISRLLRFPFANDIEAFARGKVELVEFSAQPNDSVVGVPISDIGKHSRMPRVLYAAVERNDRCIIPDGNFVIQPGDHVFVAADSVTVTSYFHYLGKNTTRVKHVMLIGGGKISYYLAKIIIPMGIHVTIIEIDRKKAESLSEELPEATVICGDGTDQDILEQEDLKKMDAFVALSNRDEENLMVGLFASKQGIPKVIVKNNRIRYADITKNIGLDSIVSPKSITSDSILRYARGAINSEGTKVEYLYRLMDGKAEVLEFTAKGTDSYINVPLKDLTSKPGTIIAVIVRNSKIIIPFGNDHIENGDRVIVISARSGISDLNEVIRK